MLWITRVPTHDNNGREFPAELLQAVLADVAAAFAGYSLDGPGRGAWIGDDGRVYDEPSYQLSVSCDRERYTEAREMALSMGRRLDQVAMYFEVRYFDGVEIIDVA